MTRRLLIVAAAYAVFVALLLSTAPSLPDRLATHFDAAGRANGWMTRDGYVRFNCIMGGVLPLFIFLLGRLISVLPPQLVNIPNRDYWLAPERRAITASYFASEMTWFSCAMVAFFAGLHLTTIAANRVSPPHLQTPHILLVVLPFLGCTALICLRLFRRFRLPPGYATLP